MVILEPDGTVAGTNPKPAPPASELGKELLISGGEVHHVLYTFDVLGIGTVALQLANDALATAFAPHHFSLSTG